MHSFKDFKIKTEASSFVGEKIKIAKLFNAQITVFSYEINPSTKKDNTKYLTLQIEKDGAKRVVFTGSTFLMNQIEQVPKDKFPFNTTIVVGENDRYEFS